jgi:hypothetical protein
MTTFFSVVGFVSTPYSMYKLTSAEHFTLPYTRESRKTKRGRYYPSVSYQGKGGRTSPNDNEKYDVLSFLVPVLEAKGCGGEGMLGYEGNCETITV